MLVAGLTPQPTACSCCTCTMSCCGLVWPANMQPQCACTWHVWELFLSLASANSWNNPGLCSTCRETAFSSRCHCHKLISQHRACALIHYRKTRCLQVAILWLSAKTQLWWHEQARHNGKHQKWGALPCTQRQASGRNYSLSSHKRVAAPQQRVLLGLWKGQSWHADSVTGSSSLHAQLKHNILTSASANKKGTSA